jgi:hypothetical protein
LEEEVVARTQIVGIVVVQEEHQQIGLQVLQADLGQQVKVFLEDQTMVH